MYGSSVFVLGRPQCGPLEQAEHAYEDRAVAGGDARLPVGDELVEPVIAHLDDRRRERHVGHGPVVGERLDGIDRDVLVVRARRVEHACVDVPAVMMAQCREVFLRTCPCGCGAGEVRDERREPVRALEPSGEGSATRGIAELHRRVDAGIDQRRIVEQTSPEILHRRRDRREVGRLAPHRDERIAHRLAAALHRRAVLDDDIGRVRRVCVIGERGQKRAGHGRALRRVTQGRRGGGRDRTDRAVRAYRRGPGPATTSPSVRASRASLRTIAMGTLGRFVGFGFALGVALGFARGVAARDALVGAAAFAATTFFAGLAFALDAELALRAVSFPVFFPLSFAPLLGFFLVAVAISFEHYTGCMWDASTRPTAIRRAAEAYVRRPSASRARLRRGVRSSAIVAA